MIIDRIKEIIKYKQISTRKFCLEVGVANGFFDKVKDVGSEKVLKILNAYPDISADWLITGAGPMLRKTKCAENIYTPPQVSNQRTDIEGKDSNNPEIIKEKTTKYSELPIATNVSSAISARESGAPLYDVSASAGYGSFDEMINAEKLVGNYSIPGFTNIDWMIYVAGASMYPKYSSGDIIACRVLRESRFIQWGKVYVLATREQGVLVKRLRKCQDENCLTAACDNPTYDSFDIPKDEILGIALVVGVIRLE